MTETQNTANPEYVVLKQRLGSDIVASLDDRQRDVIDAALQTSKWSTSHPLNIRLSIPIFKKRYYLAIVGGQEKRNPERRVQDSQTHPIRTIFNFLFAVSVVGGATVLMLIFLALYSSIIEF